MLTGWHFLFSMNHDQIRFNDFWTPWIHHNILYHVFSRKPVQNRKYMEIEIEIDASLTFSTGHLIGLISYNLFKYFQKTNAELVGKIVKTTIELSCTKITRWQNKLTPEVQRKESNKAKNSSNKNYVVSSKDRFHFK